MGLVLRSDDLFFLLSSIFHPQEKISINVVHRPSSFLTNFKDKFENSPTQINHSEPHRVLTIEFLFSCGNYVFINSILSRTFLSDCPHSTVKVLGGHMVLG